MKVTFCAEDGHHCSSSNIWLQRLLPLLRDRGINPQVLFRTRAPEDQCATLSILRRMGFECLVSPQLDDTESHVRWILKTLATKPPDVFVSNDVVPALYAARWLRAAGIPTVGVLHHDDAAYRAIQFEFVFGQPVYRLTAIVAVSQILAKQVYQRQPWQTKVYHIPYHVSQPQPTTQIRQRQQSSPLLQALPHTAQNAIEAHNNHVVCAGQWAILLHELQAELSDRTAITIPKCITLSPVHPDLASSDRREPAFHAKVIRRLHLITRRVKQHRWRNVGSPVVP